MRLSKTEIERLENKKVTYDVLIAEKIGQKQLIHQMKLFNFCMIQLKQIMNISF